MLILKPPQDISQAKGFKIFLAGSIEMGSAEDWQTKLIKEIDEFSLNKNNITIFNPRRDDWNSDWNSDWNQTIEDENFREQVKWELNALEQSNLILMYLDPDTKSPISLLELGLYAKGGFLNVCCPKGFYRNGNVDIVCSKYNVPIFEEWESFVNQVKKTLYIRV